MPFPLTPSQTASNTPTPSITASITPTITPTGTQCPFPTPTNTLTPTFTPTNTITSTSTPTNTPTNTETATPTNTQTSTPTNTPTNTETSTPTNTQTSTPTNTPTNTQTNTPTNTATPTNTPTLTPTNTPSSAGSLLLDLYPNAAIAYSTRKLRTAYSGNCIRVRRSSDNAEQDIGFAGNTLDTTALTNFITGSTDGRITTWYDQSGNNANLTQTTAAKQPWIISGGTLFTYNSKPVLKGVQTGVSATNTGMIGAVDIVNPFLISSAFLEETSGSGTRALHANNQNALISNRRTNNNTVFTNATIYNPQWGAVNVMQITSFRKITTTSTLYTNTTLLLSGTTGNDKFGTIGIGAGNNFTPSESANGRWGELVCWNASQSDANQTGITSNQQTYWV